MPETSKHETEWTRAISNEAICQYFYVIFVATAVLSALVVGMDLVVMVRRPSVGLALFLRSAPFLLLSVANSLFIYILCARTLLK